MVFLFELFDDDLKLGERREESFKNSGLQILPSVLKTQKKVKSRKVSAKS